MCAFDCVNPFREVKQHDANILLSASEWSQNPLVLLAVLRRSRTEVLSTRRADGATLCASIGILSCYLTELEPHGCPNSKPVKKPLPINTLERLVVGSWSVRRRLSIATAVGQGRPLLSSMSSPQQVTRSALTEQAAHLLFKRFKVWHSALQAGSWVLLIAVLHHPLHADHCQGWARACWGSSVHGQLWQHHPSKHRGGGSD